MLLIARAMDVVDEAALLIEATRAKAVKAAQAALREEGTAECIGCGEEIPEERRLALPSARRCRICQTRVERRDRQRRPDGPETGGKV